MSPTNTNPNQNQHKNAVIEDPKMSTSNASPSAVAAFERSLDALRDTQVLSAGGLAAYGIYAVGILVVFFLLLQLFTAAVSQFIAQLVLVAGMLLASGVISAAITAVLNFRKAALVAQLEADAFQLKVELTQQRGLLITQLLEKWEARDYIGFGEAMKDGRVILALDKNYENFGLDGGVFAATITGLIAEKTGKVPIVNSVKP